MLTVRSMAHQADTVTASSTFEAEREQLEGAIHRAWARVESAVLADPDPVVRALVEQARVEVAELEAARDRRVRTIDAAAALASRRGDRASAVDVHDVACVEHDDEPQRPTTRFPLDPSTSVR